MRPLGTSVVLAVLAASCGGGSRLALNPGDDAGPSAQNDAGPPPPSDAGTMPDGGTPTPDGGRVRDGGVTPDGGWTLTVPPPFPIYSHGVCPTLVGGPTSATALNTGFATGNETRQFRLLVPSNYDGGAWPVVFGWHWLNSSSNSFVSEGELESATEQMHFLAALPDKLTDDAGNRVYLFDWPFVDPLEAPKEILFFDDMLACISQQYNVDRSKVYAIGVSAGALWVTYLSTTVEADRFAAVESLSGGLGEDPTGTWKINYVPQANKFPAIVLWGGPFDWLIINFNQASQRYRDALLADHHFVVQCEHDAGHAIPPIPSPTDGGTRFAPLWQFMLDHPYGLPPGYSPYLQTGLPSSFPPWCSIAK
jgi:hypothetical protein